MIAINEEDKQTLYITRGDTPQSAYNHLAFRFPIKNLETDEIEYYEFQLEDEITFTVFEKKGYEKKELLKKQFKIKDINNDPTTTPDLPLTEADMKVFPISSKKQTYWYDLCLNDTTTLIGYDLDGAKKLIVLPGMEED